MSVEFVVRFGGDAMWFADKHSQGRAMSAPADMDHLPTVFTSEVEAWQTARDHGLDIKLVTVTA